MHCWGGVGRTGTTVGCWLVRHGRSGTEALAELRRVAASDENLMPATIALARVGGTTGEWGTVMREVFGEHTEHVTV